MSFEGEIEFRLFYFDCGIQGWLLLLSQPDETLPERISSLSNGMRF